MPPTPDRPIDDRALAAGLDRGWAALAAAVVDRDAPLRLPVVATAGAGGPDARVMVLRAVDRAAAEIVFFTDRRAAKVAAITADARVAVVGYDATARLQLRLTGRAAIVGGAAADGHWAAIAAPGRRAYQTAAAPGSPIDAPAAGRPVDSLPDAGRADFALLVVAVDRFEWLDLGGADHRRAVHDRSDGWIGGWRVP